MFVFIVSVLLYLNLSVSLFACLYIAILSVLPEWRINFIINERTNFIVVNSAVERMIENAVNVCVKLFT